MDTVSQRIAVILSTNPVYLDTETTGLDSQAQVCEIAIVDHDGTPLLDTLIRPTCPISAEAAAVHGIDDAAVANAPTFAEILPTLRACLDGRTLVIYNAAFDYRILAQSARAAGIAAEDYGMPHYVTCAMLLYAEHAGEWNHKFGNWRWHTLSAAATREGITVPADLHRARADAELTRRLLQALAG